MLVLSFRPGHDVAPASNLPTSPLIQSHTQNLLNGVLLSAASSAPVNVNGCTNYGLPTGFYSTQWLFSGYSFASGNQGTSVRFELTAELTISEGGTLYYFKVDPEMVMDF